MNTDPTTERDILDLNVDELEEVLRLNTLPDGVGLKGIANRKDFATLFKHRTSPKYIAQVLLKERIKDTVLREPVELKEERNKLKMAELEFKKLKLANATQMQQHLYSRLQAIESGVTMIISNLGSLSERLEKIENKLSS